MKIRRAIVKAPGFPDRSTGIYNDSIEVVKAWHTPREFLQVEIDGKWETIEEVHFDSIEDMEK